MDGRRLDGNAWTADGWNWAWKADGWMADGWVPAVWTPTAGRRTVRKATGAIGPTIEVAARAVPRAAAVLSAGLVRGLLGERAW